MNLIAKHSIIKLALLLSLPMSVHGQFTFTTNNGTITITGWSGTFGAVTIPSTTNGYPVTAIGNYAFASKPLSSVSIPNTVTSIGSSAFGSCSSLRTITLPDGLTNLANNAFSSCTSLRSVTFPNGLPAIGDSAFRSCSSLTNITFPNGLASISGGAFSSCTALTNVVFQNGLTNIGANAFQYCALNTLTLPTNIIIIGQSAFANCSALGDVMLPASVTNCGPEAFATCTSMQNITVDPLNACYSSVDGILYDYSQAQLVEYPAGRAGDFGIPNGVVVVGYGACYGCPKLATVSIPDTVRKISWYAFESCGALASVSIGKGVTNIGNYAFTGDGNLTNFTVDPSNVYFTSSNSILFDKSQSTLVAYPPGIAGGYTVPATVTTIGTGAFDGCSNLTSVTIPDSVGVIGDGAFIDCFGLTNVTIGKGVTTIQSFAFNYCNHLIGIYFAGNAPSLGSYVFQHDNATVFYLPGTIGWGTTYGGLSTAPWLLENPLIIGFGPGFGIKNGQFGFIISWSTNLTIVTEACTNLGDGVWWPVGTNTLSNGSAYFSDPQWTNYPTCFYRIRSP